MEVPQTSEASVGGGDRNLNRIKKPKKKKVLLMGKSGSGKSSMRSIIFSNYMARDTRRLGATIDVDTSTVKFLGNLTLNLWDCGGQEAFMENYLSQQQRHVFSNVGVLIYVFDIESRDVDRDLAIYVSILSALLQYSPSARIYVLIHKMDLIMPTLRESVFDNRATLVRQKTAEYAAMAGITEEGVAEGSIAAGPGAEDSGGSGGGGGGLGSNTANVTAFATSIWDQSLYKAWASIIHDLVPNLSTIEENLTNLGSAIDAEELVLFERTSFLAISCWTSGEGAGNPMGDRFDRLSNIMKSFKHSVSRFTGTPKNAEQVIQIEHKAGTSFALFFLRFTTNTYLLVALPPGEARFNSALLNCRIAIEHFKFLDAPAGAPP